MFFAVKSLRDLYTNGAIWTCHPEANTIVGVPSMDCTVGEVFATRVQIVV